MRCVVTGLDEVIEKLKNYQKSLEVKKRLFMERLAEIGINTADAVYATALYDGTKEIDPVKFTWLDENRLSLFVGGKSVLFVEFGSGPEGGDNDGYAASHGFGPGTWSDNPAKGGKGHWQQPGGWYYAHGQKSTGNPPARAMWTASKTMREEIASIAREVFGND